MKVGKTFYARNRREWRAWLARHHKSAPEIWLIYYKKHSGKPRIPYNHAVDEALCYGWIDSILKPIDADRYAQRCAQAAAVADEDHEHECDQPRDSRVDVDRLQQRPAAGRFH